MYESNFKRVEQKYLLTKEQYVKLFNMIKEKIKKISILKQLFVIFILIQIIMI